jgi:hypothetical protein
MISRSVYPGRHQVRGVRVPTLVERDPPKRRVVVRPRAVGPLGQPRVDHADLPEHAPRGRSPLAKECLPEDRHQRRRERGATVRARLAPGGADMDELGLEVDVGPLQAVELGTALAAIERDRVRQGVVGVQRRDELRDLRGVNWTGRSGRAASLPVLCPRSLVVASRSGLVSSQLALRGSGLGRQRCADGGGGGEAEVRRGPRSGYGVRCGFSSDSRLARGR